MSVEPDASHHKNGLNSIHPAAQELGPESNEFKEWFEEYTVTSGDDLFEYSALIQAVNSDQLDSGLIEQLIQDLTPQDPARARFCTRCHRLFDSWPTLGSSSTRNHDSGPGSEEGWEYAVAVSYTTCELEGSARSGCKFCLFVLQSLKDAELLDTFRKIEARLDYFQSPTKCSLSVQNWGANPKQLLWLNLPSKECTSCNSGIALSVKFDSTFLPASADCYEEPREGLDIASTWLLACCEGHVLCNSNDEGFLPTRLISLTTEPPRLVLTAEYPKNLRYATLSHCWGKHGTPKLITENLRSYMNAISGEGLPKTYRDAIMITKQLGLAYLWIDSLCIIQDDEDWTKESGMMSSVYGSSTINIAASSAHDSTEGCFLKPANFVGGLRARISDGGRKRVQDFRSSDEYNRSTFKTPLGTRAWALQEKMLSPRTIHFSDRGLFWECRTTIASEHLPDGFPKQLGSQLVRRDGPLEDMWGHIIRLYSDANLTFGKDKLPALSGVARLVYNETGDQYLAGLWRGKILEQLCWTRRKSKPLIKRPPWRAPTWTWASIDGGVSWCTAPKDCLEMPYAHVVDAGTTTLGHDPFGQVTGGAIRLACSTMATGQFSHPNDPMQIEKEAFTVVLGGNEKEKFIIQVDCLTDLERTGTSPIHLLPIRGGYTGSMRYINDEDYISEQMVEGIVLKATGCARGEYHRIGAFSFFKDRVSPNDFHEDGNTYDPFLKVLEQHGRATAEAACADVISTPEYPDQQFIITII